MEQFLIEVRPTGSKTWPQLGSDAEPGGRRPSWPKGRQIKALRIHSRNDA